VKYAAVPKWPEFRDADGAHAAALGPLDAEGDRVLGDDLADAVTTVEHDQRAGVPDRGDLGDLAHRAAAEASDVPGQAEHAVRGVTPEFRRHQRVGEQVGVRGRDAFGAQYGLGERQEGVRIRPLCGGGRGCRKMGHALLRSGARLEPEKHTCIQVRKGEFV